MFITEKKPKKTTKKYNLLRTFSYSLACLSGKWDAVIKSPRFLLFIYFFSTLHAFPSNLSRNNNQTFYLAASCNLFIVSKLYTATKQLTVVSHKCQLYLLLSMSA